MSDLIGDLSAEDVASLLGYSNGQAEIITRLNKEIKELNSEGLLENRKLQARNESLERDKDAKQAEIDSLMLEYCRDEMTEDQIKNWEKHQTPVKHTKGD